MCALLAFVGGWVFIGWFVRVGEGYTEVFMLFIVSFVLILENKVK